MFKQQATLTHRLNGWQRLWVLVVVIYFFPVCLITLVTFPESAQTLPSTSQSALMFTPEELAAVGYKPPIPKSIIFETITHIGLGLLFWILPSIALYTLGWGIGWVYRGFK